MATNKEKKQFKTWLKMWIDIFKIQYTNYQLAHEKMLNITNYQGNANQNHREISLQTCQNDYYQKDEI